MRLQLDSGLWTTAPAHVPTPLVAVLEVSGAVMSWTVDTDEPPQISFTDPGRAEWLWRVVGESGHVALSTAFADPSARSDPAVDLDEVEIVPGALSIPGRLAVGHWLRRWWPTSVRDAIGPLDAALLDAEVAIATARAEDFFTGDTIDSDVGDLLAPHAVAFGRLVRIGDPRITEMVSSAIELAEDAGVGGGPDAAVWDALYAVLDDPDAKVGAGDHQDDYALAAGDTRGTDVSVIARGSATIRWGAVPPGIFDAAEGTADWAIPAGTDRATAVVRTALIGGDPSGIGVTVRSGGIAGTGALDDRGSAAIALDADGRKPSEPDLWGHDWSSTELIVGVPVAESAATRDRVRAFVRGRLTAPPPDAFLAEIVVAESDY